MVSEDEKFGAVLEECLDELTDTIDLGFTCEAIGSHEATQLRLLSSFLLKIIHETIEGASSWPRGAALSLIHVKHSFECTDRTFIVKITTTALHCS